MQLLRISDKTLIPRHDLPEFDCKYAILSHRWLSGEHEEVHKEDLSLLRDDLNSSTSELIIFLPDASLEKLESARKISRFCDVARKHGYKYVWVDSCCIDQKNPAELQEAINSMFRWYQEAGACFVYLAQYNSIDRSSRVDKDEWFSRGWTLQELIAPTKLLFFDKTWTSIGGTHSWANDSKHSGLMEIIQERTGVSIDILTASHFTKLERLSKFSVAQRMSWYKGRTTSRPEDNAYCLMGIFSVNMPVLYGEGKQRAFRRLQEEIMRYSDDHSLFVWKLPRPLQFGSKVGILAPSPKCFDNEYSQKAVPGQDPENMKPWQLTNRGLAIHFRMFKIDSERWVATPNCKASDGKFIGFYLCEEELGQRYARKDCEQLCFVEDRGNSRGQVRSIYVIQPV